MRVEERVTLTPPTFITGRDEFALPGTHIKNKIVCVRVRVCVWMCTCGFCLFVPEEAGKLGVYYHYYRLIIDSSQLLKPATMSLNAKTETQPNDSCGFPTQPENVTTNSNKQNQHRYFLRGFSLRFQHLTRSASPPSSPPPSWIMGEGEAMTHSSMWTRINA